MRQRLQNNQQAWLVTISHPCFIRLCNACGKQDSVELKNSELNSPSALTARYLIVLLASSVFWRASIRIGFLQRFAWGQSAHFIAAVYMAFSISNKLPLRFTVTW